MAAPSRSRVVVIANAASPRWRRLAEEPLPPGLELERLSWRDVLCVGGDLRKLAPLGRPAILRIDSPDDDEEIARGLMRLALQAPEPVRDRSFAASAATRRYHLGEIRPPRQFHAGLVTALARMEASLGEMPWVRPWLAPRAIIAMFDKVETRRRLAEAGLPHTEGFEPSVEAADASGIMAELRRRGWSRAYLKLRHGWAGCGLVHLDVDRERGISTVDDSAGYPANSRRLRWRPVAELRSIMDFLIAQGATCERAVPLAQLDGDPFDARLVVIDDRVAFSVFRQSRVPITNLHLVGRRAEARRCRKLVGQRLWCDAVDGAVRATRLFSAPVAGVDIAFHRHRSSYRILELNAFGDFFPRLRDERNRTVHGAVLEALARASGPRPAGRMPEATAGP